MDEEEEAVELDRERAALLLLGTSGTRECFAQLPQAVGLIRSQSHSVRPQNASNLTNCQCPRILRVRGESSPVLFDIPP